MSIDLFIVRHGIAHDADPGEWPDDDERPLTQEGIQQFRKAARGLRNIAGAVDVVFSSPLVRAMQTADILAESAGWPEAQELKQLRSEVPTATLIEGLREVLKDGTAVALVGHEPQLRGLVADLCGAKTELKKGGVARIEVITPAKGAGTLRWLLTPKVLRAARG
ncbi:MAG: phosphohistidine phosphatase SixA [Actinomycetota bacterium]